MSRDLLGEAAQDVTAESSPAGEAAPESTPESVEGGGKKSERTIDQVRGELVRKIEEANAGHREALARIEGMLAARQAPAAQPENALPNVNNMSADQLEALRPNIPQEQLGAFNKMVTDRRVAESVRGVMATEFSKRDVEQTRKSANQEAFNRYPDLHNDASPLRRMTNKVLDELGGSGSQDPRVVLTAANEAAARLGITPTRRATSQGNDVRGVGGRTAPAPGGKQGGSTISDEKVDQLSKALQGAMPRGKKFDPERIKAAHAQYTEHRGLIIKQ